MRWSPLPIGLTAISLALAGCGGGDETANNQSSDLPGEAQEAAYLQGTLEQPRERLAARVLQHQHVAAAFPLKL